MDQTERDAAQLLAPLRSVESETPSTVDIHRAIRTVRRRRIVSVTAAAAAVVVALVGAITLSLAGSPRRASDMGAAPAEFDVLRRAFTVGSAGGLTPVMYETGRYRQRVQLVLAREGTPDQATATVILFAPGQMTLGMSTKDRAPDVNGHPAFWNVWHTNNVPDSVGVVWEWAGNAWAVAMVADGGADARTLAHRVAQSVGTGADDPVNLPFTVPAAVKASHRLLGAVVSYGATGMADSRRLAALQIGPLGAMEVDRYNQTNLYLLLGVRQAQAMDPLPGGGNDLFTRPGIGSGYTAFAETQFADDRDEFGGQAAVQELTNSVQLVAKADDPENWTTQPLR